jgi:tetratricopeptide (TPR) repeat protein
VLQFKGTRKALPEIARELKVDAVLEGSVVRAGNRVRITAQLIEGATDRHLWAQNYERDLTDVLALQGDVARAVASQIQVRLTPREQTRLAKARPVKPEAYEYYLRGIHQEGPSRLNTLAAIGLLERAVEVDPDFAAAYAHLAESCVWMVFYYAPEEQAKWEPRAYAAVDRALALDPDLAEAYVARGQLLWTPSNRFPHEEAIRQFRRALALKPNSSNAHNWLAVVYTHVGLLEEGLGHARRALAIDPTHRGARTTEMLALVGLGRYDDALSIWQGLPKSGHGELIAYVLALAGRMSEARAKLPDLLKENPEDPGRFLNLLQALLLAADGKQQESEEQIQIVVRNKSFFGHFHHTAFGIACAYARMHKTRKAMEWLERAADGYPCYPAFQGDPNLASLQKEPGFIAFLDRVKKESDYYRALVATIE